jgi:putative hemolysin
MQEIGFEIFLIFVLLVLNGIFAMSEIAVVSARRVRLQKRAEEGNLGAKMALELAESPDRFLSTVQIGITLIGIVAGAFGGASLSVRLTPFFQSVEFLAPYAEEISFGIVILLITYFSLVIGELVPKNIALMSPETIAGWVSRPMNFLSKATAPFVWLLSISTTAIIKLFRLGGGSESTVTEEEIKAIIAQGTTEGVIDETEQELMESVIRLDDQRITALMTQRSYIGWIDLRDSQDEIRKEILQSGFSRLLVCDGDLDNVKGFIKAKDLLNNLLSGEPLDLQSSLKQPIFVPETKTALEVLENFQESLTHFAVVVDEFGLTQGVVTTNDILEAIVGDLPHQGVRNQSAVQRDDGSWLLDARLSTAEFGEILGLKSLPKDEQGMYETLAGFMIKRFGNLPAIGDKFEWDNYVFEVVDMDGKRVDEVLVSPIKKSETE